MIELIDNFLTNSECDFLIKFFKKSKNIRKYKSFTSSLIEHNENLYAKMKKIEDPYHSIVNNVVKNLENILNTRTENFYHLYNAEIVKWNILSDMPSHYDQYGTEFSCIIYLNDNYIGGNTFVLNKCIKKKKGSLLIIKDSDRILHKVSKILLGTRYTFPLWYGNELFFDTHTF